MRFICENTKDNLKGATTYGAMDSPIGNLTIVTSSKGLHAILWNGNGKTDARSHSDGGKILMQTKQQLTEYFQGRRMAFDLPLVIQGTEFQIQAWSQLLKIPYGATISYAEQAEKIGDKKKARAIGTANGRNPIPIVIPCHRVIGSTGRLVGFSCGLEKKAYLLQLEQICKAALQKIPSHVYTAF